MKRTIVIFSVFIIVGLCIRWIFDILLQTMLDNPNIGATLVYGTYLPQIIGAIISGFLTIVAAVIAYFAVNNQIKHAHFIYTQTLIANKMDKLKNEIKEVTNEYSSIKNNIYKLKEKYTNNELISEIEFIKFETDASNWEKHLTDLKSRIDMIYGSLK